jgi:Phage integrase, N-terminal SAM-like domain
MDQRSTPTVIDGEGTDLAWELTKLNAGGPVTIDAELIAAYQAASSPHTLRALASDLEAFDLWCRRAGRATLLASPETVADYLDARAGQGSKPASLGRYKASIAKLHQLLDLPDPTRHQLVKLRLAAIRRRLGTAQKQARPLRFKGPVKDVERDTPRGLNIRA